MLTLLSAVASEVVPKWPWLRLASSFSPAFPAMQMLQSMLCLITPYSLAPVPTAATMVITIIMKTEPAAITAAVVDIIMQAAAADTANTDATSSVVYLNPKTYKSLYRSTLNL